MVCSYSQTPIKNRLQMYEKLKNYPPKALINVKNTKMWHSMPCHGMKTERQNTQLSDVCSHIAQRNQI